MADPAVILRQLAADAATDANLLRRFSTTRDGIAFAELVRRHGPVVLAACRRGVRHHHDADDAFQAVFLVLAREAGGIQQPELLGSWLYRVAVGVARNARRAAARRRVREVQGVDAPEPAAPTASILHDLGPLLDEELAGLPAWYREAVVLCDLRGVPRAEAAAQLGIPLGTLASRLDGARKKLAARLIRRGVTLSVGAVLVEARAVAVPGVLLAKTSEVVAVWSGGGVLPKAVLKLSQGGFYMHRALFLGVAAAVATTVVGVGFAARPAPRQPPPPNPPAVVNQKEAPASVFAVGKRPSLAVDLPVRDVQQVAWSPDGGWLVVVGRETAEPPDRRELPVAIAEPVFAGPARRVTLELPRSGHFVGFVTTPDGPVAVTALREFGLVSGLHQLGFWTLAGPVPAVPGQRDPYRKDAPQRTVDVDPVATSGYALAGDGSSYRTVRNPDRQKAGRVEVREVPLAPGRPEARTLMTGDGRRGDLAADGRVLLVTEGSAVAAYEVPDGKLRWRRSFGPGLGVSYPVASADGGVVAVFHENFRLSTLDGRTGQPLPSLEGVEQVSVPASGPRNFSVDNRLVAFPLSTMAEFAEGNKSSAVAVWDAWIGNLVQSWRGSATVAFHPSRLVLAVLEPNGDRTRLGLWDFTRLH